MMSDKQENTMQTLKRHIKQELPIDEYNGEIFTEVQGVTVRIGPNGGIELPSIRHYPDPLEAAVDAGGLFRRQRERDDANPARAALFKTGHFNPRWDPRTQLCSGDRTCPRCRR
jgi:hypothetical protein